MRTLLLELRPTALIDSQLSDLLKQLAESTTGRARIPVTLEVEGACSLPPDVKVALYRIAQESVSNVAKHADASQVTMTLRCTWATSLGPDGEQEQRERVELRVHDDGRGFNPVNIRPDCLGVGIMRERAQALGITLTVESEVGRGTEVVAAWTGTSQ
jgi:two-component system nitrate/nitrite sensor histidine kinase NarX